MSRDEMERGTSPAEEKEAALHRNALLRYVIIMFAVALVLVLLSMVLQTKSSNATISDLHHSSTSALTRAEALQNANRELEDKLKTQQEKNLILQNQLESLRYDREAASVENKALRSVYDALITVLMGADATTPEAYQKAVDTVNTMKQYLTTQQLALFEDAVGTEKQ